MAWCGGVSVSYGQILEWKTFTSVGEVRDIAVGGGVVWSGSNGGALQVNPATGDIRSFTNTEGLSFNEITAVEIDQHGTVWFALADGLLNRYTPELQQWQVFEDYENEVITDLVAFGDSLYVGLDFGVSLFTIDKKEVKETYVNFGFSTGGNLEKIGANAIYINGTDIWVATDRGIAQSSLLLPNLQAPSSWTQHTVADGLPSNEIHGVTVAAGVPYAATASGMSRFLNDVWQDIGLINVNVAGVRTLNNNAVLPDNSVLSMTGNGIFWLNAAENWQRLGAEFDDLTAFDADDAGAIWIGRKDKGLATYSADKDRWELFTTNSPSSNDFKSLVLDPAGRLWCASRFGGVHMFDGTTWTNFNTETGLSKNDQRSIIVDAQGRVWSGSWGGGITVFEEQSDGSFNITKIDTAGGILAGIAAFPGFVLTNVLKRDQFDNIWVVNRDAANTRVLAVFTPEGQWIYFSQNEGLFTGKVDALEIDKTGRVWVGTENRGVKVLDYNGTINDKSDDDFSGSLTQVADNLFSDKITALLEDRDGTVWIGTEEGVNFWFQGQVGVRFGLINDFVNTIGVDARNNKWFGTKNGVSVLSNDGVTWTHYTTGNSPLVNGDVQSFAFNQETGEVWIGTSNGLSRLQTPFTAPKANLSLLTGFPNPFIIAGSGDVFTITNLAENSSVSIFTTTGKLVREYTGGEIEGAQVFWDGRDEDGQLVASGIYVYLAATDSNISAAGKVAVVRR